VSTDVRRTMVAGGSEAPNSAAGESAGRRAKYSLDDECFKNFAPLLLASQDYSNFSGCRFRSSSFDGLLEGQPATDLDSSAAPAEVAGVRAKDRGPRLAAKLKAAPEVRRFRERLRAKPVPTELQEEVDKAFRIVMTESVRNAMMGMFQALSIFPPDPHPADVAEDDCAYEDVTAPLPTVAQRLYNDQARRLTTTGAAGHQCIEQRAMTAAFLVDFVEAAGVKLPPVSETHQAMLRELSERVAEETKSRRDPSAERTHAMDVFFGALGVGAAADQLREEAEKWWKDNWRGVAWATGAVALAAVASALLSKRR